MFSILGDLCDFSEVFLVSLGEGTWIFFRILQLEELLGFVVGSVTRLGLGLLLIGVCCSGP